MRSLDNALDTIVRTIWASILGLDVQRCSDDAPPSPRERSLTGWVEINGAWQGAVALSCSTELARQAAAIIFESDPTSASTAQASDVIAELVNITGGNLKGLMPEPCQLSIPEIIEPIECAERFARGDVVARVAFECLGEPLLVSCMERPAAGLRA